MGGQVSACGCNRCKEDDRAENVEQNADPAKSGNAQGIDQHAAGEIRGHAGQRDGQGEQCLCADGAACIQIFADILDHGGEVQRKADHLENLRRVEEAQRGGGKGDQRLSDQTEDGQAQKRVVPEALAQRIECEQCGNLEDRGHGQQAARFDAGTAKGLDNLQQIGHRGVKAEQQEDAAQIHGCKALVAAEELQPGFIGVNGGIRRLNIRAGPEPGGGQQDAEQAQQTDQRSTRYGCNAEMGDQHADETRRASIARRAHAAADAVIDRDVMRLNTVGQGVDQRA